MTRAQHSTAEIIRYLIISAGLGIRPTGAKKEKPWAVYVSHTPDGEDRAITCYDTPGYNQGRLHRGGETIHTPGWQIRTRAVGYDVAYDRIFEISEFLDTVNRNSIDVDGKNYMVLSVAKTSYIVPIGQDPDGQGRRDGFTLNGTILFRENL